MLLFQTDQNKSMTRSRKWVLSGNSYETGKEEISLHTSRGQCTCCKLDLFFNKLEISHLLSSAYIDQSSEIRPFPLHHE